MILALDTSSAAGSAALVRDGAIAVEQVGDASRTHGERLPLELMAVLDAAGVGLRDVDGFAVCVGPGSFTGLRVGIATVQGLAFAQGKHVTPVSAFEGLAFGISDRAPRTTDHAPRATAVWIDAHRGEVFATLIDSDHRELIAPTALKPEATLEAWAAALTSFERIRFAGDGSIKYREIVEARFGRRALVDPDVPPLAGAIGRIAAAEPGRAVRPHAIAPLYVRRPDAVLARERRDAAREAAKPE